MPKTNKLATVNNNSITNGDGVAMYTVGNNKIISAGGRSVAGGSYRDVVPNLSIRESYGRSDYDTYRTEYAVPRHNIKDIISSCRNAYKRIGIIRNVIDLMTDFTTKGMRVVHPVRSWEKIGQEWANRVKMVNRANEQTKLILRDAIAIMKRSVETFNQAALDQLHKTIGAADVAYQPKKNEIPVNYTFINPISVEITDDNLGKPQYWLRINSDIGKKIFGDQMGGSDQEYALLPEELKLAARKKSLIKLDKQHTIVHHYKKDDWSLWSEPFTYSILDDLITFEKMKLADITALDGAISHIRIWKLGNIDAGIMPTPAAVAKLADMLARAGHGGTLDVIWDAMIELQETSTDMHHFLGEAKYAPVLNNIYAGIGIPPTLTGSANSSGFTNNFISLKTLTERLNYVRNILRECWLGELKILQIALGAAKPFGLEFDHMSLTDEAAEKKLLLDMVDRNLVGVEHVQRAFGADPNIEDIRVRKDHKRRKTGKLPPQAGPYHQAEHDKELEKIALQKGLITPGEVGMELEPRKPGEKPAFDKEMQVKKATKSQLPTKKKGVSGQGRPKNSKDSTKRKQKRVVPRTRALMWATSCQKKIDEFLTPIYLKTCGKSNLRQLSTAQTESFEQFKFTLLANIPPNIDVTDQVVENLLNQDLKYPQQLVNLKNAAIGSFIQSFNRKPTMDEIRNIEANIIGLSNFNSEAV